MDHLGEGAEFLLEAIKRSGAHLLDGLERHDLAAFSIERSVNDPQSAAAQFAEDLVAGEGRARCGGRTRHEGRLLGGTTWDRSPVASAASISTSGSLIRSLRSDTSSGQSPHRSSRERRSLRAFGGPPSVKAARSGVPRLSASITASLAEGHEPGYVRPPRASRKFQPGRDPARLLTVRSETLNTADASACVRPLGTRAGRRAPGPRPSRCSICSRGTRSRSREPRRLVSVLSASGQFQVDLLAHADLGRAGLAPRPSGPP